MEQTGGEWGPDKSLMQRRRGIWATCAGLCVHSAPVLRSRWYFSHLADGEAKLREAKQFAQGQDPNDGRVDIQARG